MPSTVAWVERMYDRSSLTLEWASDVRQQGLDWGLWTVLDSLLG